ncbi:hypothetical protein EFR94_09615 [Levilactobacillus brevis]|uniref:hypothetical protein n=1 Tax=Levilactobacillus brevis TaxID=1580 RepID=UPI0021A5B043|nr:hypothetical protein [Levilactobacillus brevis]MCT3567642.1 hypothetical protein [Levilactobacillus brevis]
MKKYFSGTDILIDDENATTLSGMVNDPTATADSDGNKYLRAGTLLTSDKDFETTDDGSAVLTPTTDATIAQGILRHDYNIIEGAVPASVIISGTINRHRMDTETQKVYTADLKKTLKVSLPKISVIDRD